MLLRRPYAALRVARLNGRTPTTFALLAAWMLLRAVGVFFFRVFEGVRFAAGAGASFCFIRLFQATT